MGVQESKTCVADTPTCTPGQYVGNDNMCYDCDPNTYSTDGVTCMACPTGQVSDAGSSSCHPCAGGTHYDSVRDAEHGTHEREADDVLQKSKSCVADLPTCTAGQYLNSSGNKCEDCAANTYSAAGATSCTACPSGQVSAPGSSSCHACESGTHYDSVSAGIVTTRSI